MNTQEVIELLNLQEIQAKQEVIKKYQVDKATIIRVHANDKYDLSNGMVNIQPMDTSKKFSVGDSVFLQIPTGDKQQTKIVARSNIKIPDEELYEYGEEPVKEGTIYLGCSNEGIIKVYSLDGTPGTDISQENAFALCTDGIYLYFSSAHGYSIGSIKIDGGDYKNVLITPWYNNIYGLAVNPDSTYLYTIGEHSGIFIDRIKLEDGTLEDSWKEITEVEYIQDLCSDSTYLYILNNILCLDDNILVYDFEGNFIRNIETSGIYEKITSDGTNIYLNNSSVVDIYTTEGAFVRSISESGIRATAVKDGKIYIVTEESGGGVT